MDEATHAPDGDAHPIDARVRTLMDQRLETARRLADAAQALSTTRAAFDDAQREYGARFKDAEKAGWDRKELTGPLGLEEPSKAPRQRRASKTRTEPNAKGPSDSGRNEQPSS
ncbi:hypothetical protein M3C58_08585 [Brachybacterium muris]|uniref:hypothetical protein n=1 Tax=Brachybacterium muris TaxID=219301 RepID=UPI0021A8BD08|nr:hypothetical protein [Brachybacterium muris]MCT1998248.1 hypothetical protein [Brachybacterium muris]